MARNTISFEGGTAGGVINSANSPSGATQTDITGSPTSVYSSTTPAVGSLCWSLTATTAGDIARIRRSGLSVTSLSNRYYFRLRAAVSASGAVIGEARDTSSAVVFNHVLNTANSLSVVAKTGGATTLGTLSLNTWYRIEAELTRGSSSTTGVWTTRVYVGNDTTVLYSQSSPAADLGTANLSQFNIGKNSGTPTLQADYDDFVVDDGTTTPIGPPSANVRPVAGISNASQTVQRGTVVTLNGTDSDSDGTVVSRQWTVASMPAGATSPTLTGATTSTVSFTPATPGLYVLQYNVTDNAGASPVSPATAYVNAYPLTGEDTNPYYVALGSWTKFGSGTNELTSITDSDASTGILSPTNPTTGQVTTIYLDPIGPGTITVYISGRWIDAAVTRTVTLAKSDNTVVKTWTVSPTNSDAEVALTVDAAGLALVPNVADRAGLTLKIAAAVA